VDHSEGATPTTAVIIAGGEPIAVSLLDHIPPGAFVIAADSGLHEAQRHGVEVDLLIGDLDSADPSAVAAAETAGTAIERHPADKDATDLALALARSRTAGCGSAIVFGGHGGRLSHLLGNALALTDPALAPMAIVWHVGGATVTVVTPDRPAVLAGGRGDLISLLAIGGPAGGVSTTGLRWVLAGDTLDAGSTRGMSNEMIADTATVSIGWGAALAIHERTTA